MKGCREMDNTEKKRLANEKRLKAVQEWQKNRHQSVIKTTSRESLASTVLCPENTKVKLFDSEESQNLSKNQLKLFDSDDEDDDFKDCFKIRPQFEGRNGQRMLEMSSELADRFKLDERFKDEEEPLNEDDPEDSEKNKNIRILESILGHEVSKKHPVSVSSKKKRQIERFDPEDEKGSSCVKNVENVEKKVRKKIRKNEASVCNEEIPYSSERYIEVTSNLKEIMSSAGTFSFSEKFNSSREAEEHKMEEEKDMSYTDSMYEKNQNSGSKEFKISNAFATTPEIDFECSTSFKDPFFISDTDARLKEGIEFFMRTKSLDEMREEWLMKRNEVLEIFKRKKKSAQRGFAKQPKQNQRKKFPLRK